MSSGFVCPECGKREFKMTQYKKSKFGYAKKTSSGLFECSACDYKERI